MKTDDYREKLTNRIFYLMRCEYGSRWVIMIGDDPIAEIKQRWTNALQDYTAYEIGKAVKSVKSVYKERPPTMYQFAELVKSLKNCKLGHESIKEFDYGQMEKTSQESGNKHIDEIRGML